VFTRDDLLTGVWGYEPGSDTRLVDVHVGRLRKKLEDATVTEVAIETARGFGYRLVDATRGADPRSASGAHAPPRPDLQHRHRSHPTRCMHR
jgi:DNA-binding winged helix-turn-helix (wHTH) protein